MSFLIAEILGLLVLAALCGGALVYWWHRRHLVDVSSEYARYERTMAQTDGLRTSKAEADVRIAALEAEKAQLESRLSDEVGWRGKIEPKLDELRPASLDPVLGRLDGLDANIGKIRPADLSGVQETLAEVKNAVASIESTDVSKIESGVVATSAAIAALRPTNLGPVETKLEGIEARVAALRNTDLSAVDARVRGLTDSVTRVEARITALPATDLSPMHERLDAIEQALKSRPQATAQPRTKPRPKAPEPPRRRPGALLDSASFGKPDDLKTISGVGPKLEGMLNDIGVYYFFQVGSWSDPEVEQVDEMLKVFKGRIQRDGWVDQARELAGQPGAARMRPALGAPATASGVGHRFEPELRDPFGP